MLAWIHANGRENIHAKLNKFYDKSGKNVTEWIEKVRRVAMANN